jgi:hypothetical protein
MAKKVIANLNIQLGASSATLRKDFKRGSSAVRGFAKDVGGSGAKLQDFNRIRASAGAGLGSLTRNLKMAAIGMVGMVTATAAASLSIGGLVNQFEAIDKTAKTADKLGETTEALLAFNHAAALTGVATNDANVALQRMTRRISSAAAGGGAAHKALQELGVDAAQLSKMAPTAAFAELADAFKGVESSSDRVRLAFALFDSAGVNLVNTLALGKSGLAEVTAEARKLGLTFDREAAAKVEAAKDAMERMGASARGLTQQMAISLAPVVIKLADGLTNLTLAIGQVDLATVKTVVQLTAMAAGYGLLVSVAPRVITAIKGIVVAIRAMTTAGIIAQGVSGIGLAKVAAGLAAAGALAYGAGKAFDQLTADMNQAETQTAQLGKSMEVALPEDLAAPVDEAADKMAELARENERWISIGQRITASVATPLEKFREDLEETHEALRRGKISFDIYERSVQKLADDFTSAEDGAKRLGRAMPTGGVSAAVRGTASGATAVRQSIDAGRQMSEHLKRLREAAKKREKQLEQIISATQEVEAAVWADRTKIVKHRIMGA